MVMMMLAVQKKQPYPPHCGHRPSSLFEMAILATTSVMMPMMGGSEEEEVVRPPCDEGRGLGRHEPGIVCFEETKTMLTVETTAGGRRWSRGLAVWERLMTPRLKLSNLKETLKIPRSTLILKMMPRRQVLMLENRVLMPRTPSLMLRNLVLML